MKAADIKDETVIDIMTRYLKDNPTKRWVNRWHIQNELRSFPFKVVNAKLRGMVLRNKIEGCSITHNCRGDFAIAKGSADKDVSVQ